MNRHLLISLILVTTLAGPLWAEDVSYDRYAPIWGEGPLKQRPSPAAESLHAFEKHFLVYPFELVRWPIDETLYFIEDRHLDDKADWIYEQMKNHGFTPKIRSISGSRTDNFGGGFDIELLRLLALKDRFPNTTVEGSAIWTFNAVTDYQVKLLQEQIAGTGVRIGGNFGYETRGEAHFYGIGPHSSLGDGTSYRTERTTLETLVGYGFLNTWDARGKFSFQNVNVGDGDDGRRGIIDDIFVRRRGQTIPGLAGDEMLSWGLELEHDNRDNHEVPTGGGYERFHFSFNKGTENNAGFFKYRGEIAHFFKFSSERRVLAFRGVMEHNDEIGDREVPFFEMARLGGYGTSPRIGDAHRGYRRDRFYDESVMLFNAEYRWNILEYRDWRVDPAVYCDVGQVFGEWSSFRFDDFRVSYGLGLRVVYEKEVVLSIDIARGNEGTEFYVKTRTPF